MSLGPYKGFLTLLNANWRSRHPEYSVDISGDELTADDTHSLAGEIAALCHGQPASLPYFHDRGVIWCTVAQDGPALRAEIANLRAWLLGSLAVEDGGIIVPTGTAPSQFVEQLRSLSPSGYFKWKSKLAQLPKVTDKLILLRALKQSQPKRVLRARPSLYQLRVDFSSSLLVGNRIGAENALKRIDDLRLDTAANTLFFKIRLWHHFREFESIRNYPELGLLLTQPIPPAVRFWLRDAGVAADSPAQADGPAATVLPAPAEQEMDIWERWLAHLRNGEVKAAESVVASRTSFDPGSASIGHIKAISAVLDDIFTDDALRVRQKDPIAYGVAELLKEFVREPDFPRAELAGLYLSFFRVWGALYSGVSTAKEHGNVLLEMASALLRLSERPAEILPVLEGWWKARPVRSQLPFLLDMLELLDAELPDKSLAINLWIEGAKLVSDSAADLPQSELACWRKIGVSLGLGAGVVGQYLPATPGAADSDALVSLDGKHVAIVCMRTPQARAAADAIMRRCTARVTIVDGKSASALTTLACTANVVLFVWMATTHAVFRAFDGFDRARLSYVQGTGPSSIVRSLERWASVNSQE